MKTKYTKDNLQKAVDNSTSLAGVLRYLGLRITGGGQKHIKKLIHEFEIDTSHFLARTHHLDKNRGWNKLNAKSVLVVESRDKPYRKRRALHKALQEIGRAYECVFCGTGPEWNGKPLTLQIDHINGKAWDNREENLRYLCPNCHSQTETFGSKNGRVSQQAEEIGREPIQ